MPSPEIELDRLPAIAGSLRTAAARFGTPLYLTDESTLADAADELRAAFPDPWVRQYSVKANDAAAVIRLATGRDRGFGANVVSRGEWAAARKAGVPNDRISLEGIGKTDADLDAAIRAVVVGDPLLWVAVESAEEADALEIRALRAGLGRAGRPPIDVLVRLNPEVTPETQAVLAVGAGGSKFGMTETELTATVERLAASGGAIRPRGIHLHVGSQLGAIDAWRDAVRRALAVLGLLRGGLPDLDTLDVGGGFAVLPLGEPSARPARFAREIPSLLEVIPADRRPDRLAIEPGRFVVARAGWLVGRVLHVRERGGRQVVLDVGMTELIRPALYGGVHPIVALTSLGVPVEHVAPAVLDPKARPPRPVGPSAVSPTPAPEPPRTIDGRPLPEIEEISLFTAVHGPICESTDALGEHDLPPLRRGDLVAIRDAGAYAASLSSTYNGRPRAPQVILTTDGRLVLARRRGSVAGLG
ncbi:MAG: diaminopimelate decarboxylase [Chloroflexota bacterium]|nr:diaminopimelate decarboxylase [Chloroflexota bacterium]MEA2605537.1 diaminopimelate decarboxylase [Chloroflexota bacterium]